MAKKKEVEEAPPGSFTDRALALIESGYGDDIAVDGLKVRDAKSTIISVSPSLDAILGGGIMEGSWVGITGAPKTCKTSTALCIAAKAQLPVNGSRPIFYLKIEGRLSPALLKGTPSLDLSKGKFTVITSKKGRLLSAQDYLEIASKIIETVPGAVLVIDSISTLLDEREQTGGIGTETRGGTAKLLSQFIRLNMQAVPVQDTIVLGITHQIANTSGMGPSHVEKGGQMWKYVKDYDLKTSSKTFWKVGEKTIGYEVKWVCNTSKTGLPGRSIESYIRFNHGIDEVYELLQFAIAYNVVKKAGAWLSLEYLAEPQKFCGAEATCAFLRENTEAYAQLQQVVAQKSSGVEMVGGEE